MDSNKDIRFLMGNEAIARGIMEAGCSVATAYPGTPSSEVLQSLVRWKNEVDHPIYLEWSINEKVAFEVAYGASLSGARSAVIMKMVGLNVASDPLTSAAYLGVRGGLVIVVADDPGPHSSQTEQDSRFFGWFAKVPVLDPGNPREAREMAIKAFELSERYEMPVILRPCLRVCHARQNVAMGTMNDPVHVGTFQRNWQRWAAIPKFRLILHEQLNQKLGKIRDEVPEASPTRIFGEGTGKTAFITSGSVSSHLKDIVEFHKLEQDVDVFKIDLPFPANLDKLQSIADTYNKTLVVEETYPVLELQIANKGKVFGRLTDHVPSQGELTPELVERIVLNACNMAQPDEIEVQSKPRRPSLCAGCPHRSAFFMIKTVFDKAIYSGDIGCYTLGINMGAVDTCLCMGASIGMAAGLAKTPDNQPETKVVSIIGDSTFFHSGIPALINAVHTGAHFVLVIMDNNVTTMTGGQPTPAHNFLADGRPGVEVSIEQLVAACGVRFCEVVDPYDYSKLKDTLVRANEFTYENMHGISVIITRRPCVRTPGYKAKSDRFSVNEKCDKCMTCFRELECPAIEFDKDTRTIRINDDSCAGCGFCVNVCPSGAIELKAVSHV